MKISIVSEHVCHLGEGPVWDHRSESLYWVDSLSARLFRFGYSDNQVELWDLPGDSIGSLAVREAGGLILAMDQGFYRFSTETGAAELILEPLAQHKNLRFNDGKVDPFGHFVAGAMNRDYREQENAAMYRLSPGFEVSQILDGFTCFNGPCFDQAGSQLYVTGRREGVIEVLDYGNGSVPGNARDLLTDCNPDGATVDAEGFIWSAQWSDQCLLRISPRGKIDARIDVPGQIVSSLMFGGPDLTSIFVTTIGDKVENAIPQASDAGKLLVIEDSGYQGRAEPYFRG